MNLKEWDMWPEELHSEPDQIKRQASAQKADMTPKEINDNYAVFKGSKGDYMTTLGICECMDFHRRRKPCKHMYRLAFELGLFNLGVADVNSHINEKLRINEAMEIIETLPEDLQKVYRDVLYDVYYGKGYSMIDKNDASPLIRARLVKDQPDKEIVLNKLKKDQLLTLLPEGVKGKSMKKSELIDYIVNNSDIDYAKILDPNRMVVLDESVSELALAMYRRLFQKYPIEREDWWS